MNEDYIIDKSVLKKYIGAGGDVVIPAGVTEIGKFAFEYCTSLANVTIPFSVKKIGFRAFAGCTSLTRVTIPDGVTEIDGYAFENCTSLESVTIPDSVTWIGVSAFEDTAYCKGRANWEDDLLYISHHLIKANDSISATYSIKPGTLTIADGAFASCTSLTSVTIPNSVKTIGCWAFSHCTSLVSVTIPDSVTSIYEGAFDFCALLTIHAPSGSYAEQYAKENNIQFVPLD